MSLTSIIIPTHSRPDLLTRSVKSALASGTNVEVIVVDDASADETADVCASLHGITYVRVERNLQVAGARNKGLLASRGKYISFLDDDDVRLPDTIDEQVDLLEKDDQATLVYGQALIADQSDTLTGERYPMMCKEGDAFWSLLSQNFIPCGTAVFRRSCVNELGLLDDTIPGVDDWDFWVRMTAAHRIKVLEKPVMIWRQSTPRSKQGTSQAADIVSKAANQFRRSWMKLPRAVSARAEVRKATWRRFSTLLAAHLLYDTKNALQSGDINRATKNCFAMGHLNPWAVLQLVRKRSRLRLLAQ